MICLSGDCVVHCHWQVEPLFVTRLNGTMCPFKRSGRRCTHRGAGGARADMET